MQITDLNKELSILPLWRQAFRPFFLFGSLFGIVAIALWLSFLNGYLVFSPYDNPVFWHAHEMIFGFVAAFIVGFLLTAVQNWTGLRAVHGTPLILLFSQWLLARILLATNFGLPLWLIVLVDVSFFITAAFLMATLVIKANNKRNLFFVPVLILLAVLNLMSHVGVLNNNSALMQQGLYAAILQITLLMTVIGGRVIPMFTANGTNTAKVQPLKLIEIPSIAFSALFVVIFMLGLNETFNPLLIGILFAVASLCHLVRVLRWRPWLTLKTPLVWSLHLAYWFIPLGYGLFSLHYLGFDINITACIHALSAGAMSTLILAMIARVSLGHTGRKLSINRLMAFAFAVIVSAGIIRVSSYFMSFLSANTEYLLAGSLWILAFTIYLVNYVQILLTPRADNNPG